MSLVAKGRLSLHTDVALSTSGRNLFVIFSSVYQIKNDKKVGNTHIKLYSAEIFHLVKHSPGREDSSLIWKFYFAKVSLDVKAYLT